MKLSFFGCLALAFNAGFFAVILFVICEVAFAQGIKEIVDSMMSNPDMGNPDYWWAFLITILGLFVAMIVATFAGIKQADNMPEKDVWRASGYGFILNLLVWLLICYVVVFIYAPDAAFAGFTWVDAFAGLPRIITFAAQYRFTNVPMFWIYFVVTYEFVYAFWLWFFEARVNSVRKYKQKDGANR
jgi:hypothetical protein